MVAKLQDPNMGHTLADITQAPVPMQTKTYTPIPNRELVEMTLEKFRSVGREPSAMGFNLNKDQTQMLAVIQFEARQYENPITPYTAIVRNSYNKKWSVGIAAGLSVFYCTNMMISGSSFKFFRKHTSGVRPALDALFQNVLVDGEARYKLQMIQQQKMMAIQMSTDEGYELLGRMYGNDILKPRMFATAVKEWKNPRFETFKSRDLWSLYNAATYGVKASSPRHVIKHNPRVHDHLVGMIA